eukprot:36142-Pyramimonas_sp.AAC.1
MLDNIWCVICVGQYTWCNLRGATCAAYRAIHVVFSCIVRNIRGAIDMCNVRGATQYTWCDMLKVHTWCKLCGAICVAQPTRCAATYVMQHMLCNVHGAICVEPSL